MLPTSLAFNPLGLVLAHWLADEKNSYRPERNSTVLELGSGCGLPGIIAAKATNAHVYFSDKKAVWVGLNSCITLRRKRSNNSFKWDCQNAGAPYSSKIKQVNKGSTVPHFVNSHSLEVTGGLD